MKRPGASRWGDVMDQVKLDLGPGLVMPVFCKGEQFTFVPCRPGVAGRLITEIA